MSASTTRADIIVVNYHACDYLIDCVRSLETQTEDRFRCFIIDNSPETGDVAALGELDDRFVIEVQSHNTGFAAGCNRGVSLGSAPWVVMFNPDACAEPDWLKNLLACAETHKVAMVGSTQIMARSPGKLDGAGDVYTAYGVAWRGGYDQSVDLIPPTGYCFSPCAAASAYRRDVFEAVGGLDERFFCYMEDVDIAYRLRLVGERNIQCREAIVTHVGSATSGRASPFVIYHGTRNRIWTFLKNTPPILFWLMLPLHVVVNLAFLVRSRFHDRFGQTWKGTRDGFAGWTWIRAERKSLAKSRKIGSWGMMRAMTWSPTKLMKRAPDVRPLNDG